MLNTYQQIHYLDSIMQLYSQKFVFSDEPRLTDDMCDLIVNITQKFDKVDIEDGATRR